MHQHVQIVGSFRRRLVSRFLSFALTVEPEKRTRCNQANQPEPAPQDPDAGAGRMHPRAQKPDQNQVNQQNDAGYQVSEHATPCIRNCAARDAPETSENLKTRNSAMAINEVIKAAIASLFTQRSDCAKRTASAGIAPRGDKAAEGPRTRR